MNTPKRILDIVEFNVPVYGSRVTFIVFLNTWRDLIKYLKGKGFDTREYKGWDYIHGLQLSEHVNGEQHFVVIVKKNKHLKESLVHELFHLTQDILEYKGVPFVEGGANEPYSYLIGTLFTKVEKLLK